jgi:tRNA(Ser,Leu) C12 N-acetylase TAN1
LNLIVTCGRNLESEAKNEIKKIINELGDQELEILDSGMRGVLTVNTVVKPSEPWILPSFDLVNILPANKFSIFVDLNKFESEE